MTFKSDNRKTNSRNVYDLKLKRILDTMLINKFKIYNNYII